MHVKRALPAPFSDGNLRTAADALPRAAGLLAHSMCGSHGCVCTAAAGIQEGRHRNAGTRSGPSSTRNACTLQLQRHRTLTPGLRKYSTTTPQP